MLHLNCFVRHIYQSMRVGRYNVHACMHADPLYYVLHKSVPVDNWHKVNTCSIFKVAVILVELSYSIRTLIHCTVGQIECHAVFECMFVQNNSPVLLI